MVERSNPTGDDEIVVLLSKVSSQDSADFTQRLKETEGVRQVRREREIVR